MATLLELGEPDGFSICGIPRAFRQFTVNIHPFNETLLELFGAETAFGVISWNILFKFTLLL
ncbi:hypothetical protein OO184_10045 [Photorhabdus sp. APURE]|uniref:hypothetical protein n=1 Tax=Photorhabdus aballayi TaxID=2991723 RepID=UPI00223E85FC|nr:hypothetical protein [Photorhabdus aballayi]MCW7548271.1 hypothetical protein [Photorhabdus aballayi]